jgi:hypothetical protein
VFSAINKEAKPATAFSTIIAHPEDFKKKSGCTNFRKATQENFVFMRVASLQPDKTCLI